MIFQAYDRYCVSPTDTGTGTHKWLLLDAKGVFCCGLVIQREEEREKNEGKFLHW
jgi:hypothetical protein